MSMNAKDSEETKNKESIIKLLNIIKKNNVDSNLQIKLNNIEKRVKSEYVEKFV